MVITLTVMDVVEQEHLAIRVSILLERLKTEGVVDMFHTVRSLRLQSLEVVASLVSIGRL